MRVSPALILMLALLCVALTRPVRGQEAESQKRELIRLMHEYSGQIHEEILVDRLFQFRLTPACWQQVLTSEGGRKFSYLARDVKDYLKRQGLPDLADAEYRGADRAQLEQTVSGLTDRFSWTVADETAACDSHTAQRFFRYLSTVGSHLGSYGDFKPRSGSMHLTVILTPGVQDVSVDAQDGRNFTVKVPAAAEPARWDATITGGLDRGR